MYSKNAVACDEIECEMVRNVMWDENRDSGSECGVSETRKERAKKENCPKYGGAINKL